MSNSSRCYEIVPVIPGHVRFVGQRLRRSDIDEIWSSVGTDPLTALEDSVAASSVRYTIILGGAPAAIFGAAPAPSGQGIAWLLGTEQITRNPRAFWLASKEGLGLLFTWFSQLFNYVDQRNVASLRWLKKLGAQVAPPVPFGIEARPFHYFELTR